MLHLLLGKYHRKGFEVSTLEIEGLASASTMGFQIRSQSGLTTYRDEFRFQKFSGGFLKARWSVYHRRLDEAGDCVFQQLSWVSGLANALSEAEALMAGKRTPYATSSELAEAVASGWV